MYPEYEWLPWKFVRVPRGFWADTNNQKKFLNWAQNELGIKNYTDWYKVTPTVLN